MWTGYWISRSLLLLHLVTFVQEIPFMSKLKVWRGPEKQMSSQSKQWSGSTLHAEQFPFTPYASKYGRRHAAQAAAKDSHSYKRHILVDVIPQERLEGISINLAQTSICSQRQNDLRSNISHCGLIVFTISRLKFLHIWNNFRWIANKRWQRTWIQTNCIFNIYF